MQNKVHKGPKKFPKGTRGGGKASISPTPGPGTPQPRREGQPRHKGIRERVPAVPNGQQRLFRDVPDGRVHEYEAV